MKGKEIKLIKYLLDAEGNMLVDKEDKELLLPAWSLQEKGYVKTKPTNFEYWQISLTREGCLPAKSMLDKDIEEALKAKTELNKYSGDWTNLMRKTIDDIIERDKKLLDKLKKIEVCKGIL
ncbi:MAG: hypothetical protein DRP18_04235 [Candidatus Aenigmatarchaeota archaeon]|nr:MAG: hypothetical protein DRP18_04235 [Candidatus Aenigmarchaeota archaeon]